MKRAVVPVACLLVCCSDHPSINDAGDASAACDTSDAGTLANFCPPVDPGPGGIVFTASGEALAITGYPFPPKNLGDTVFVDGWDVKFDRLVVTVDKVTLSNSPDLVPGDPSRTGALVAEVDGPWAIDLARSSPSNMQGKGGGGEQAVPFAALSSENRNDGHAFATDGTRYAFGFDLVAATAKTADGRRTTNVNLDADGLAQYETMITRGCVVEYVGTATFKGDATCNADALYASWPKQVRFDFCFRSPSSYVNCQNPDNQGTPLPGEESLRGIALLSSQSVIAQVTVHTDHPFWDSVLHDTPAHFDQFAARVAGQLDGGVPTVTLDMEKGVDYTSFSDALGQPVPWRYCIAPPIEVHPKFTGRMSFDAESVSHAYGDDPSTGLRDYLDFSTYDQSTQGHLNSDGLCFVRRNYPSPP